MRIRLNIVMVSIFLLLITKCSLFKSPSAVRILEPKEKGTLTIGKTFQVKADIDFDYQLGSVEMGLWDVESDYDTTLWVYSFPYEEATFLGEFIIEKVLIVPSDAPPSDNYRLEVTVITSGEGFGYGNSLTIRVRSPND